MDVRTEPTLSHSHELAHTSHTHTNRQTQTHKHTPIQTQHGAHRELRHEHRLKQTNSKHTKRIQIQNQQRNNVKKSGNGNHGGSHKKRSREIV